MDDLLLQVDDLVTASRLVGIILVFFAIGIKVLRKLLPEP